MRSLLRARLFVSLAWEQRVLCLSAPPKRAGGAQDQSTRTLVRFSAEPQPGARGSLWLSSTSVTVRLEVTILPFAVSFEKERVTHSWSRAPQCGPSEGSRVVEGIGVMGYCSTPSVLCPKNRAAGCRKRRHKCIQPSKFPRGL